MNFSFVGWEKEIFLGSEEAGRREERKQMTSQAAGEIKVIDVTTILNYSKPQKSVKGRGEHYSIPYIATVPNDQYAALPSY
jgi:hypothetical protein